MAQEKLQSRAVQTTGHAWDGDLQEYNNPLPTWWLWAFFATVAVSVAYWILFPAWPVARGFTPGAYKISYVNDKGDTVTSHWNTRAQLMKDMNDARAQQKPFMLRVAATPYEQLAADPEMAGFVNSAGKALFSENCAACHQAGGQGKVGFFPALTDDDWIYGGSFDKIHQTISHGRSGYMPPFREVLSASQIDQLAAYVLSLSGKAPLTSDARAGEALFKSEDAACYYCHTVTGTGRQDLGAANLTDQIWLWADVRNKAAPQANLAAVRQVISNGLNRGVMPAWNSRLDEGQIKLLTLYARQLGGAR